MHLLVVDPRSLTRDCLVAALDGAAEVQSVTAVGTIDEAAAVLADSPEIAVTLLNLASDAFDSGTLSRTVMPLQEAAPSGNILVITALTDSEHTNAALCLGVNALLSNEVAFDLTLDAIRVVSRGLVIYPRSVLGHFANEVTPFPTRAGVAVDDMLTNRQRQVLDGLSRGMTNRQIAVQLSVTERTVKAHVKELMRRLGASNRTQVVAIASSAQ